VAIVRYTNEYDLPQSIVRAVQNDPYSKGHADFSATGLLKPPQIARLTAEHEEELTEDVSDSVWKLLGHGVHTALERASTGEGEVIEQRLFADIEVAEWGLEPVTYVISGAIDLRIEEDRALTDYKVTATYQVQKGGSDDWGKQLNIYDWLCWKNDIDLKSLRIAAFMRDWKKSQKKKKNYPQAPVVILPVDRWSHEAQERFIAERIVLHTTDPVEPCTKEEIWGGIRCEDWCAVAPFCPQYNGRAR